MVTPNSLLRMDPDATQESIADGSVFYISSSGKFYPSSVRETVSNLEKLDTILRFTGLALNNPKEEDQIIRSTEAPARCKR